MCALVCCVLLFMCRVRRGGARGRFTPGYKIPFELATFDQGALPMDQPAITGRFSSRTPVDTVPKPTDGGAAPHQFPPSLRPTDVLLKKIGLTCVLSAFLIGCVSLVRELLSSQNIKGSPL